MQNSVSCNTAHGGDDILYCHKLQGSKCRSACFILHSLDKIQMRLYSLRSQILFDACTELQRSTVVEPTQNGSYEHTLEKITKRELLLLIEVDSFCACLKKLVCLRFI